ncbi:NUDIX hydrolase [Streptomyces aureoversilis]|uniref:NUDIX hydrolase n=1 Tax=Streptomyces aureoversilis TaxID=67277 RepID=A0ABV9ZTU4_9ACTN
MTLHRRVCCCPAAPSAAIAREVREELGLARRFSRVLVVDWVPPSAPGYPADFPGEMNYVFDGGALTEDDFARIRLPEREVAGVRRAGLPVTQAWGWLFAGDGRVLVLIGQDTGSACLPGGTVESADHGSPVRTLRREAWEKARVRLGEPLHLGYLDDNTDNRRCARARYAAAITSWEPPALDEATGQTYARLLATPEQTAQLFDWGAEAAAQIAAVHTAREKLGLPAPDRQPLTELPPAPPHSPMTQ